MASIGIDLSVKPIIEHIKRHLRIVLAAAGTSPKPIGRIAAYPWCHLRYRARPGLRSLFRSPAGPLRLYQACAVVTCRMHGALTQRSPAFGIAAKKCSSPGLVLRDFHRRPLSGIVEPDYFSSSAHLVYQKYGLNFTPNRPGCQWGNFLIFCNFGFPFMQFARHIMKDIASKKVFPEIACKSFPFLNLTIPVAARIMLTLERAKVLRPIGRVRLALFLF